jgi:hypothetical protein
MAKSYDPACYKLAEHFLRDEPISEDSTPYDYAYEQACHDLALTIQQAVEDWFTPPMEQQQNNEANNVKPKNPMAVSTFRNADLPVVDDTV